MDEIYSSLKNFGSVKLNEPLSKHTTFKIGGPADYLVVVSDTEKLVELLKFLAGEGVDYFILGGGSNMLVRDQGFRGVAIKLRTMDFGLTVDGGGLWADAGSVTVAISQESIKNGLTGFEWGVGVPGTIGGAVRGNAGAMGGQMKDVVESVMVYQDGEVITVTNAECKFGYRDSCFKHGGGVILRVTLRLEPRKEVDSAGMKKALEYLQYRNKTQPQGWASTGCIFKNLDYSLQTNNDRLRALLSDQPEKMTQFEKVGKISAGWLVESAGLKGEREGKALVSERHGNFIVNEGGATADEVLILIDRVKQTAYNKYGVELEEEIQII